MEERKSSPRRELRIVIIDDDPCALEHEASIVSRIQNRDGCHIKIWPTTKPDAGLHRSLYSPLRSDVVIVDISMNKAVIEPIAEKIKNARPDIILIGITAHIDRYDDSETSRQYFNCIIDKAELNHALPAEIEAIYHEKILHPPTRPLEPKRTIPPSHCTNGQTTQRRKQRDRKSRDPHCSTGDDGDHSWQQTLITHKTADSRHGNIADQTTQLTNPNKGVQKRIPHHDHHDHVLPTAVNLQSVGSSFNSDLAQTQEDMTVALRFQQKVLPLSPAELRVINLCSQGMETDEVADSLSISSNTVYSHRSHIMGKYHVHSWHEALIIYEERKKNGTA
ncbi:LuxR C-terminal-related transcriptional regulator [Bifidobacterium sp. ESL0732]|uniref:LuxR C-terminal-related transcriptional regulator n=1 Tax=Bifidobacterium sp. ESL0732 TaxID=2983222 RepID=UPI0023F75D98|nr:LuxR C-terminal-related transcriptional regulator [Bifidobacterium sp. ESL0732]WEV63708.1 LuxR C-terminal-related transcriptional regulator [Bifidobacterium sp. ESL0732]